MIRRLIEADVAASQSEGKEPSTGDIRFWLAEAHTPAILQALCRDYPLESDRILAKRPSLACVGDESRLLDALHAEEKAERELDREYWEPLRRELENLRRNVRRDGSV